MIERIFSREKQQGFTLIEVLISITVFSILTLGMLQFFNQALDFTNKNEDKTLGIYVARNMMNFMKQQNFQNINDRYIKTSSDGTVIDKDACSDKMPSGEFVLNQSINEGLSNCPVFFTPTVNNRSFAVTVTLSPYKKTDAKDLSDSLIPMTVNVQWEENETSLEGYITSEKNR
ncbi:type IV pilus modification PilV family protein [Metabacillus mangrovi]|uniref:type IV pilus modification PilV family protein n=1 Tax=Metabacillus mangrovi TaxID=1491830 RepID=UPI001391092A|nr:type II secretion system protein [Metabacillus mangrovi]